jgi:putative peptidoglycan lipid II flippase
VVNILVRAFFALGDTKTPMIISSVCLGLNLLFALLLVTPLRQGGLALANTLSALFNVWLLYYALRRKLPKLDLSSIRAHLWGLVSSGVLAGMVAWVAHWWWERQVGHTGFPARLGAAFVPLIVATGAYYGAAMWLKIPQAKEMLDLIKGRLGR